VVVLIAVTETRRIGHPGASIEACRLCGSDDIRSVIDLGFHPLADTFLPANLQRAGETSYPLELGQCVACGHVFTLVPVSREDRYQKQDYSYDSSNSKVSIAHFHDFFAAVLADRPIAADALVVDIGSNVGTLLSHFRDAGYSNVLGIEPSHNISAIARDAGIPTITDFFDQTVAEEIDGRGGVELLLSSNVVNHADNIPAFFATARSVLKPGGRFVFEVPYLLDLLERTAFDTIYHEHVHYYGVRALASSLSRAGFSITRVERLDYMCGSIRVFAQLDGAHAPEVLQLIETEYGRGLYRLETYVAFMERVRAMKLSTNEHLWGIRASGGRIIGIGAATKGNTFLNYCGLDADVVFAIADASKLKIGKITPGSHIPIIADEDIGKTDATHALILPWNIADFLKAKLSNTGLEFYVPQVEAS
jgi:SAM-dependent methyltransferase